MTIPPRQSLLTGEVATAAPLRIDIFTLFPAMFEGPFSESILKRGQAAGLLDLRRHEIRDWALDRHRTTDDSPYGGGAGMVMKAPPIVAAVEATLGQDLGQTPVILLSAGGHRFDQTMAEMLATRPRIALICGHYEGVDERVVDVLGATELAIGDYVLTGGELAAMVVVDAVCRLVPGVIKAASVEEESHAAGLIEYPHYTRPVSFRGQPVPPLLLSGNHGEIARWRREQAILRTARRRPDLLASADLTEAERTLVASLAACQDDPPPAPAPPAHVEEPLP